MNTDNHIRVSSVISDEHMKQLVDVLYRAQLEPSSSAFVEVESPLQGKGHFYIY